MIGDLMIVNNIERRRRKEPYRIQVVCTSCNSDPYWARRDHLRYGRNNRCTSCQRRRLVLQTHGERPPEPTSAIDESGETHDLVGLQKPAHPLHWLYRRCYRARDRCENKRDRQYKAYGGRGIKFRFDTPAHMAAYLITLPDFRSALEDRLTIDRIFNDGHYCEGNLRWADQKTQNNNQRTTRYVRVNDDLWVKRQEAVDRIHEITGCSKKILGSDFHYSDTRDFGFVYVRARLRGDQEDWEMFGKPDVKALKIYRDASDMYSINAVISGVLVFKIKASHWNRADFTT